MGKRMLKLNDIEKDNIGWFRPLRVDWRELKKVRENRIICSDDTDTSAYSDDSQKIQSRQKATPETSANSML